METKVEKREPVEYEVLEKSLIGNEVFEAGSKAFYNGLPAENLKPLCAEGEARAAEYVESNKARVAKMIADNAANPGEFGVAPDADFAKKLMAMLAQVAAPAGPAKRTAAA